jgi:hypothetical protein
VNSSAVIPGIIAQIEEDIEEIEKTLLNKKDTRSTLHKKYIAEDHAIDEELKVLQVKLKDMRCTRDTLKEVYS